MWVEIQVQKDKRPELVNLGHEVSYRLFLEPRDEGNLAVCVEGQAGIQPLAILKEDAAEALFHALKNDLRGFRSFFSVQDWLKNPAS